MNLKKYNLSLPVSFCSYQKTTIQILSLKTNIQLPGNKGFIVIEKINNNPLLKNIIVTYY